MAPWRGRVRFSDQRDEPAEQTAFDRLGERDGLAVRHRITPERDARLALPRQVRVTDLHRDERGNRVSRIVEGDGAEAVHARREKTENVAEQRRAVVRRVSGFRHRVQRERKENNPAGAVPSRAWETNTGAATRGGFHEN